jgi:hypothetical protein
MAPPLVPSPMRRPAPPPMGQEAFLRHQRVAPGLALVLATSPAPDQAIKPGPAVAALAVALAQALVTLPVLVLAEAAEAGPVEVVGTNGQFHHE